MSTTRLSPSPPPNPTLPPTPPSPALSDIYTSDTPPQSLDLRATEEILSDLPSRRRDLSTSAYREALSAAKGTHVQSGFDEGYSLGAELGVRIGGVLGVLGAMREALEKGGDKGKVEEIREMEKRAREELRIEKVLGEEWVDGEGVWRWGVEGGKDGEEGVTFREVAGGHPVVRGWVESVEGVVRGLGVELGIEGLDEEES